MATQRPENGSISQDATESDKEKGIGNITPAKPGSFERHSEASSDGVFHQIIVKDGQDVLVSWTLEEEKHVVRKADFLFLPIFALMFTWMAIDRTNVSGVLTSTFLHDTGMTRDQANTGVSLLWLGIVLLEIPSNVILHRIGPTYWIPGQVVVWGLIEVLQCFVKNSSGWYAARLFLGMAESGFIPGGLYTLSRWYTEDELTSRTAAFFFGPSISAAFGSLISSGALRLEGQQGLIFIICGVSTIATGVLAFAIVPKSPYHTGRLFGGLLRVRGWLSEREADIFSARLIRKGNAKSHGSTLHIGWKDITDVIFHWATWPYLIACLSGLQAINGLSTWGATIIKSLGFSSIHANLLNAPGFWTLACLIALYHLPVSSKKSWSFYAAYLLTQAAPGWQPINVTWLSLNFKTPQKRAIAYAVYSK
ncbi:hypothetical protein SAPIO_CDS3738 [Scedosporium apiospermum]|uniref:Major facilitator superfamily (MFS) profile domain-containing protein n=1 Tax=Pseudallescheria apiosperma TaxID=563466 RepID=A0A084G9K7_PSEDA|nr:uncharacterized protein SAPIO_CDS3738 [Scedosporium apiospermum]KEZ44019.1 hypothetical protein SAPIO_CDS3738 [Scedosporium apiospermum]